MSFSQMAKDASRLHDLTDLTTGQGSSTVYPTEDSLLSALHARFRSDLPYTRIGGSTLVAINPLKSLASVNDASAQDYEQVTYRDTESDGVLQPHIYEMASRAYLVMRRTNRPQSVVFRGIAASGKSYNARLLTNQLLRLSTHSKRDAKVAEQIKALHTLLDSFGQAKTALNPSASRHNRYLELQFSDRGRIAGAKTLLFGLDKSRLIRLGHEERSFHIFYQLIAGAYPEERDQFYLEDPSEYALLASSGCYRLPAGPFSDDSVAMEEVRAAFKLLGFKSKNVASIFNLLVVILLLGNIQFYDVVATNKDQPARITNPEVLERAAHHLSISAEDLAQALVNKTNYVRKELYTVFLTAEACRTQLNHLIADLYAILFSYIVEMANAKLDASPSAASESGQEAPPPQPLNHIVLFDSPGFYSRTSSGSVSSLGQAPLISAQGQNSFEEFSVNFVNEIIHSHMVRLTFEDSAGYNSEIIQDGISLPSVNTMDNSACVELLRGVQLSDTMPKKPGGILGVMGKAATAYRQGKSSGDMSKDEQNLLSELVASFGVHASFVSNPAQDRNVFAINHYAGQCTYDVRGFIEKDADVLDSAFVSLLRQSSDGFISRLVSGPSLAVERHHKDPNTVVQAQVTSRPLRQPSVLDEEAQASLPVQDALDPTRVYPVTTQLNASISQVLRTLSQTTTWTVNCIRPNDSGLPNSFDKRRIKLQIRSLLLPDHVARRQVEYMVDYDHDAFCERYSVEGGGELIGAERIRAFARAVPWMREGVDFAVGHRKVWFTYPAWKAIDDGLRADEKDERKIAKEEEAASMAAGDEATTADHHTWKSSRHDYAESVDELLLRQGADPNTPRFPPPNSGVPRTPGSADPFRDPSLRQNAWSEAGDARSDFGPGADSQYPNNDSTKELVPGPADGSFNIKELEGKAVEEVPTSAARRWWVRFVWMQTWWIPTYLLTKLGRMKRPDVRLAWREKVTICLLIFYICGFVIFLILGLGRIICPEFNKAWTRDELLAHTNDDDFWVAVYGQVYDLTNFWRGNHGVSVKVSDSATMKALAGQDLTNYFPIPFTVSCPGLVNDEQLTLNLVNETEYPTAVHTSGSLQTIENTDLRDPQWFMKYFLPKMKDLRKGQLVFDAKKMRAISQQDESVVKWAIWDGGVYDLSDYFNTLTLNGDAPRFKFMDDSITSFWTQQAGQDISKGVNAALAMMDEPKRSQHTNCLNNAFYRGVKDFRNSARCAAPNWILVGFAVIIGLTILAKFLAALQLSGKRNPEMLDKFVICQVPCYTEGEESLRRTIDSLAALRYDDKRKLIFLICDGNIIGSGNDRPTPRIVLDILGVDPKLDPEPLLFKSIAEGSKQLNYGKVYSGLYEFEGHVVP
ncbi:hypothetical protein FRC02_006286 [Tulasnella sp. 418]|nr:hypothetical protein FRC02_006286 [Tulasnella sp. 418]